MTDIAVKSFERSWAANYTTFQHHHNILKIKYLYKKKLEELDLGGKEDEGVICRPLSNSL